MITLVRTAIDAWAREGRPNVNYGAAVRLWVNGGASGNDRQAFLHFARPFPLGATILSATLRLYTRGAWSGSQTLTAKRVVARWSESRLTWNQRPGVVALNAASLVVSDAAGGEELELDVTAMLQDVSSGAAFFGFRLELGSDVDRAVHSAESLTARLRPVLEVEWATPPDAPTPLAPIGGRAVSIAKPLLTWTYRDVDAGVQTSSEVEVDDAEDFASPVYDSGKVANDRAEWDLAATAFGGITAGQTRYWRARVWDDADVVSEWSDPVEFTRTAKGSVAIVSPAAATVDDLSPPIDWTYTPAGSEVQEAYRVRLLELVDGVYVQRWSSGRVTSTAGILTLPEGLIVTGGSYRVEVRVWDDVDRAATATDPDYVEDTHDFTYARSGAPAAVTSLTATPSPAGGPGVMLEWSRANQPDYFCLRVDGVEVLPRIDPTDVFVSGTTYRMTYWRARPRIESTYEVEAVVDSGGSLQHSDGNATADLATNPTDIWLVDEDDGVFARLKGQQGGDFSIGVSGTTHYLRGRRAPVRITDTVRGYEGDVAGLLKGGAMRDAFLELYGRLKPLRLIVSDLNIEVELDEVAAPPTALSGDRLFGCSFGFAQVGDFTFDVAGG